MPPVIGLDPEFAFEGIPPIEDEVAALAGGPPPDPLGPLAQLPGTWKGNGFNTIWRPHHPDSPQDHFLELNLTTETLVFSEINGAIPNRGLLMPDISMFGVTYLQQISETGGPGLHIEPGIWANVPATTDPAEPATVVRMASIPHGTVILAQGTAGFFNGGPPVIPATNITPFNIGGGGEVPFPETDLSTPTPFRHVTSSAVTQAMVDNPNSVLEAAIQGKPMKNRTHIQISTKHTPIAGGGLANTAFLADASAPGGNANAVEVDAIFWIQTLPGPSGQPDILQLQYTQTVVLNFSGLSWPHVTVGTLRKQ